MNLGARIKKALEMAGLRAPDVSRATDVPVAALNALLRRDSRRSEYTEKILSVLPADKVNHEWVRTGLGSPDPGAHSHSDHASALRGATAQSQPLPTTGGYVPARSWEHRDGWPEGSHMQLPQLRVVGTSDGSRGRKKVTIKLEKHALLTFTTGWMRYDQAARPAALAWGEATDNSMETVLYKGDCFVVDTDQTEVIDGKTYVIFYEDQQRVRRLFRLPGGRLRVEAINSLSFPSLELTAIDAKGVTIVGRVVHRSGPGGR